jgi:hypothetical protein
VHSVALDAVSAIRDPRSSSRPRPAIPRDARRAPRRPAGRTPFDPERARSAGRSNRTEDPSACDQARRHDCDEQVTDRQDRWLADRSRATIDLPRRTERPEDRMASGINRAPARLARRVARAGRGRLEGHRSRIVETASSETDCTRDSARARTQIGITRLSEGAQSGEREAVSGVPRGRRQRVSVVGRPRRLRPAVPGEKARSVSRRRERAAATILSDAAVCRSAHRRRA